MRFYLGIAAVAAVFGAPANGQAACREGVAYVTADVLNVRARPVNGAVVNRLYRRQKLTVYECRDAWAKVSDTVERWVHSDYLSRTRPAELPAVGVPDDLKDPRIPDGAIPERPGYGLTADDVLALWKAANLVLERDPACGIKYAGKSVSRRGSYYVMCDDYEKHYFTRRELE